MLIKIDYRETDLFNECEKILVSASASALSEYKNIKILSCSIPLGDIIICNDNDNDNDEKIIIERKTLNDLAASIRDGRYTEQGFRLNECNIHNHNIIYAIEGDLRNYKSTSFSKNKIDKKALLSALTSIQYFKGFSIMRTINVTETAEWIIQMADKIQREEIKKNAKSFYENVPVNIPVKNVLVQVPVDVSDNDETTTLIGDANEIEKEKEKENYTNVVANKRIKKNNVTPENIGEIMLSQIPGISTNVAIAIMKKFGTIQNLIETLKKDTSTSTSTSTSTLKDIVLDKNKHLNKTHISNLYKFFNII